MSKRKKGLEKLNLIKEVLESQGKTQTWLAEKLDLDFVTVTRYVNNKRQPTLETLFDIAQILKSVQKNSLMREVMRGKTSTLLKLDLFLTHLTKNTFFKKRVFSSW